MIRTTRPVSSRFGLVLHPLAINKKDTGYIHALWVYTKVLIYMHVVSFSQLLIIVESASCSKVYFNIKNVDI